MSYFRDPGPGAPVTEFELADGETLTVDLREFGFPMAWSAVLRAGAVVTHHGANADAPEAEDWLDPAEYGIITESVKADERTQVAWLRWATAGGTAKIAIIGAGSIKSSVA